MPRRGRNGIIDYTEWAGPAVSTGFNQSEPAKLHPATRYYDTPNKMWLRDDSSGLPLPGTSTKVLTNQCPLILLLPHGTQIVQLKTWLSDGSMKLKGLSD